MEHNEYLEKLPDSKLIERLQCGRCLKGEYNVKCKVCQKAYKILNEKHKMYIYHYALKLYHKFHKYTKWDVKDFEADIRIRLATTLIDDIDAEQLDSNYKSEKRIYLCYLMEKDILQKKYTTKKKLKGVYNEIEYSDSLYMNDKEQGIDVVYDTYDWEKLLVVLTDREKQVLDLTLQNYKSKEIAEKLGLSKGRVSQLRDIVIRKLKERVKEEQE